MKSKFLIIIALFLVSCSQPKPKDPSDYVDVDFRNMSISDFIKKVSVITGKKFVLDTEIKGKINFVSNKPIQVKELIPLANAILETKQMTLVNKGDDYVAEKSSNDGVYICTVNDINHDKNETMKTMVFELGDLNSAVVRTKIKPLLSRNSKVIAFKKNNLLSVTDTKSTLRNINMLIEKIKRKKY